jgi:hypothetical protein
MATKVHQMPVTLMGLGTLARATVLSVERHLSVWIAEHALAQHAAAEAALSRRQVRDIHALYIGSESLAACRTYSTEMIYASATIR